MFTPRSDIPPEAEKILDGTCSYAESAAHERAKGCYNVSGRARDTLTHTHFGEAARSQGPRLYTHSSKQSVAYTLLNRHSHFVTGGVI